MLIVYKQVTVSWKQNKTEIQLQWKTNRKLCDLSITLSDPERSFHN